MNDMSTNAMPDPLLFTENAANKVKALIEGKQIKHRAEKAE